MKILFQDEYIVAIDKPAGLLVHKTPIAKHETEFAVQILRDIIGRRVYPIHRLDKPASGVLLFAFSPEVTGVMSQLFMTGSIEKSYMAVVRGYTEASGIIDYALSKIVDKYGKSVIKKDEKQEAVTHYKCLAKLEVPYPVDIYPTSQYSLVELKPKTGRRHQLRRHLKHIFHPIIGDNKYGKSRHNNYFQKEFNCERLLLSAVSLKFVHPYTGAPIYLHVQPDDSFLSIIKKFNFDVAEYLRQGW